MFNLNFEYTDEGRARFEICHQAIVMTTKPVNDDNEDDFISLLGKLEKISVESKEKVGRVTLRDLQNDGGVAALDRSEYKLLTVLMALHIWRPVILAKKRATQTWLKEIKDDQVLLMTDAKK